MKEKKKIIIRFVGGLGNQLFIYAFYLYLKKNTSYIIKLDKISGYQNLLFGNKYNQNFVLKNLNKIDFSEPHDCLIGLLGKIKRFFIKNFQLFRNIFEIDYITETNFFNILQPIHHSKFNKIYLDGYFQNIKYLKSSRKKIQNIIKNIKYKKSFPKEKTLCILFSNYNHQSEDEKNYYLKNLKKHVEKNKFKKYVIFSIKKPYKLIKFLGKNKTIFIKPNSKKNALKNLSIMSSFKYYFSDNSTYHWWGTWFSKDEKKIVFIPKNNSNLLFYKNCKYY